MASRTRSLILALWAGLAFCLVATACGDSTTEDSSDATTDPGASGASGTPTPESESTDTEPPPQSTTTAALATTTTAEPVETTVPATTAPPASTIPAAQPGAGRGFDDFDLDDPATAAALSVRAGSAFLMLSEVFIDCLDSALEVDPAVADLVDEMAMVERGSGLSPEAADLAATCMATPGYVEDVRDSWIGTETEAGVVACLTSLFDVEIDIAATSASLQIEATEADVGGVTMASALTCSANDLLIQILSDSGLDDITAEESQCIATALAEAQSSGESQFGTYDFISCLSDGSHNSLAAHQFRFDVFGTEGRCLNEYLADNDDPNTRIIDIPLILGAHTECGTLGRFVNDQNGGRFGDDEVACINDEAAASMPQSNADLSDIVNGCI